MHATVLPMTGPERLADHAVLVDHGLVVAVVPSASVDLTQVEEIVDLTGKYVLPGFHDMHVHLSSDVDLTLFAANGVTTVRDMAGNLNNLQWAGQVRSGTLFGSEVHSTGPMLVASPVVSFLGVNVVRTPQEARVAMDEQLQQPFVAFKVHDPIERNTWLAILERARVLGRPVVGHVPPNATVTEAIDGGYLSMEHLKGYDVSLPPSPAELQLEQRTVSSGVFNCPTLVAYWTNTRRDELNQNPPPGLEYVSPALVRSWRQAQSRPFDIPAYQALVRRLSTANAQLVLGTDSNTPFVIPGFSFHQELALTVEAGLTPLQALGLATRSAGAYWKRQGVKAASGTLVQGERADL
ncbi:MAG: hypothetical protein INH41_15965, partial [Myxococcaceae bacterium]|nr:hypothetical protein [Myxococcaceae bacterium]